LTAIIHDVLSDLEIRIKKTGGEIKLGEFPVILTFTKPESIDVVVRNLQAVKTEMETTDKIAKKVMATKNQ
jgi:hypothetical protein